MRKIVFLILILILVSSLVYFLLKNNILLNQKKIPLNIKRGNDLYQLSSNLNKENLENAIFLEINSPKDKEIFYDPVLIIKGKTIPLADIFINDKETKADKEGNFIFNYLLDEGENDLIIITNDDNGNFMEKNLTVEFKKR